MNRFKFIHFLLLAGAVSLTSACQPGKAASDNPSSLDGGNKLGPGSYEKIQSTVTALKKGTLQQKQVNKVSLTLRRTSKSMEVHLPFFFNSQNYRNVSVSTPKLAGSSCGANQAKLFEVDRQKVYGLQVGREEISLNTMVRYEKWNPLGNYNSDHTMTLVVWVAKECTRLDLEFFATFD